MISLYLNAIKKYWWVLFVIGWPVFAAYLHFTGYSRTEQYQYELSKCINMCHPLIGRIEGKKPFPDRPDGWRNYEMFAKCVCRQF